jgi:hypothetical protein
LDEPWVISPKEFSSPPPRAPEALSMVQAVNKRISSKKFLGKAVGSVHESLKYWKDTFEDDVYVRSIIENGYKIPVIMTDIEEERVQGEQEVNSSETRCN